MAAEVTSLAAVQPAEVEYGITEIDIARVRANYKALSADSREGYEEVRQAIAHLRTTRTGIEKRRVELKAAALEHGRRVDSVAKQLTAMIVDIETPLLAKKAAVDDEKERIKRAEAMAELLAAEAKLKAEREAEEARLKAERDAETERLRVENERLTAQRAADEAERQRVAEVQRAAQEKIDAAQRALDEQRQALEAQQREVARVEAERQQKARTEKEAVEQAERDRIAAEKATADAAAEAARLEAMKPDIEKVRAWAEPIRALAAGVPAVESPEAHEALAWAVGRLAFVSAALEKFKPKGAA